jgi:uncharacterized protein
MLISFRVSNFLSFNEEVEFSMLAGQPRQLPSHVIHTGEGRNRIDILKSAVIYGANASGKSNLIKAMDFARNIIVNGIKTQQTYNKHFRLDPSNIDKPTKFEFEFKIDDKIYAYGFSLNLSSQKFISEWLSEVGKTTDKPIFERTILTNGQSKFNFHLKLTGKTKTRFEVYQEDVLDSQLFLTELGDKNLESGNFLQEILNWFSKIKIMFSNSILNMLAFQVLDEIEIKEIVELLSHFDTHILDIESKTSNLDKDFIDKVPNKELLSEAIKQVSEGASGEFTMGNNNVFLHSDKNGIKYSRTTVKQSNKNTEFEIDELSDGVRRLLDILPILNQVKKENTVFIIDEIDRSLHPELSQKIIQLFHEITEGVESQLIVTTHESSLLDLNLLRRDEIWFAEKSEHGESHLYSLEEFKPRHDVELRKAYLLGRFGAIPFISDAKTLGWGKKNLQTDSKTPLPL